MIAMAEASRNATLREIKHHRATLVSPLRRTVEQIEEDKYEILNTTSEGSNAA
jgi:hypothetical protein